MPMNIISRLAIRGAAFLGVDMGNVRGDVFKAGINKIYLMSKSSPFPVEKMQVVDFLGVFLSFRGLESS